MIKVQFSKEHHDALSLMVGIEFSRIEVPTPHMGLNAKQLTLTLGFSICHWSFYCMCYKPANVQLNRKQRRAMKLH